MPPLIHGVSVPTWNDKVVHLWDRTGIYIYKSGEVKDMTTYKIVPKSSGFENGSVPS